jgi:tartrate-resistant acid phosphatase type 5
VGRGGALRLDPVALGDFGVGIRSDSESSRRQRRVAEVLDHLVAEHDVRFVVSLGDNIYIGEQGLVDSESGGEDDDWYSSYFQPYRYALARVPVFPAIGNHDTTETEGSDDRAQMEDNFHTHVRFRDQQDRASVDPGLFYRLRYGRDVELVCLDTSQAEPDQGVDRLFQDPGVRLVLAGHEHNFQVSEADGRTYVVSGAGGKVREDVPEGFQGAHTRAWAAQSHLLLVEVDGDEARLTPLSGLLADGHPQPMTALTPRNEVVYPPLVVRR